MLMIIGVEPSGKDLIMISKNSIINEIGDKNEVVGAKIEVTLAKCKNKN